MTIPASEVGDLLVALIRNECVNDGSPDSGHEARSVETITEYLGVAGRLFEPHPGRQSALWRVRGTDPDAPSLMLLGHTDVVPANPATWTHPPFSGERSGGWIWGRGAVDMLNVTAAMAAAFKRVLDGTAHPPEGDVIFLAVADEEAAGTLGARWITENHWDDVACDYLLTEVGAPALPTSEGTAIPVTVAEKGPNWRRLKGTGISGHGSQPYGTLNAIVPLAEAITRLAETPMPVDVTDEWRAFVAGWAPESDLAEALLDVDRLDEAIDLITLDDPSFARWIHACTHLTVTPTVLHGGVKSNVVPDSAVASVDIRALPGQDTASILDHLRKAIGPALAEEIEIEAVTEAGATSSVASGPLWDAIGGAVGAEARLVPTMIPVATDARFWRSRGTVAYGIGLYDDSVAFGEFLGMFHGADERITEASLGLTADLIADVIGCLWS